MSERSVTASDTIQMFLTNPNKPHYETHVRDNTKWKAHVVRAFNARKGKRVVLCGAGPGLAWDVGLLTTRPYDELWACNRALTWLTNNGYTPTHAVWVDPGDAWKTEWADPPDVQYYISTSVQPALLEHLAARGRRFQLFHNWIGILPPTPDWKCPITDHPEWEYETWLYASIYPSTVCVGAGLNAVNRALALALYHGFDLISVLGADCCCRTGTTAMPPEGPNTAIYTAWLKEQLFYPPGNIPTLAGTSALDCYGDDAALMEGVIDGRRWVTRPDMVISATNLARLKAEHGARIELIGDTLPNALLGKPEEFMASLPQLTANSAITNLVPRGALTVEAPELVPVA